MWHAACPLTGLSDVEWGFFEGSPWHPPPDDADGVVHHKESLDLLPLAGPDQSYAVQRSRTVQEALPEVGGAAAPPALHARATPALRSLGGGPPPSLCSTKPSPAHGSRHSQSGLLCGHGGEREHQAAMGAEQLPVPNRRDGAAACWPPGGGGGAGGRTDRERGGLWHGRFTAAPLSHPRTRRTDRIGQPPVQRGWAWPRGGGKGRPGQDTEAAHLTNFFHSSTKNLETT